ncbi:monocarboxylate transporter 13-like [Lissotriton helveticus]
MQYQKSTAGNSFAFSCHPNKLIQSIPLGELLRAKRNCSTNESYNDEKDVMITRFKSRGYNQECITTACKKAENNHSSDLNFSLYPNRGFVMFQLGTFLFSTGTFMVYVHLVSHGKDLGLSSYEAAFLMSVTSLADMCSRPLSGWFADLKLLSSLQLSALWASITGLSMLLLPLDSTFQGIMALGLFYGLNTGAFAPMFYTTLPDLVTTERTTSAVELSLMVTGFAALLGPPFSGFLRDLTGGFMVSFIVFAAFTLAGSGIMMCSPSFFTGTPLPCQMKKNSELPHTEEEPPAPSTMMRLSSMDESLDSSKNNGLYTVSS